MPRVYIGVTDGGWYSYLSQRVDQPDEVNFWQPSSHGGFRALRPGELFLFKLHSPNDFIVGYGVFAHYSSLSVSLAWDAFGDNNGLSSLTEMTDRLSRYSPALRRAAMAERLLHEVGCILLEQPVFLPRGRWIPVPDWHGNIVRGKGHEGTAAQNLIEQLIGTTPVLTVAEEAQRYGEPVMVLPRLGQGSFRVMVGDAYGRRCAITGEKVYPALDAAHIRPYALGGEHRVSNGLLLRRDIHALYDKCYLTVLPDHTVKVSPRVREEFQNGRDYYALDGREIALPASAADRPNQDLLEWHSSKLFLRAS